MPSSAETDSVFCTEVLEKVLKMGFCLLVYRNLHKNQMSLWPIYQLSLLRLNLPPPHNKCIYQSNMEADSRRRGTCRG